MRLDKFTKVVKFIFLDFCKDGSFFMVDFDFEIS